VAEARGGARKIAFIKRGRFSYSNDRTLEQLRRHFPEHEIEVIDVVQDLLRWHPWVPLVNLLAVWRAFGRHMASGTLTIWNTFYHTPFIARQIRRLILGQLGKRSGEFAFTLQTQSLYDAHLPGVPHFVYTDHTHLANLAYPSFDRAHLASPEWIDLEHEIYDNATLTFVMGSHVERSLVSDYGVAPGRIRCVYAGSNIDPAPVALENDGFRNGVVLFIGTEWERKGGPTLLAAFEQVRSQFPNARLIIVGCEPDLSSPGVEVRGRLPREEVKELMRRASVFCLPTRVEPFGIACIEAAQHGLPVVATRIGAIPDIVLHEKSGLLVEPDDCAGIATALGDLLSDPDRCRRFGECGRAHVLGRFTWDATGAKIASAIRECLKLTSTAE
jgi:glycosyltransferase involved in cell wall biosynthesis